MKRRNYVSVLIIGLIGLSACSSDNSSGAEDSSTAETSSSQTTTSSTVSREVTIANGAVSNAEIPAEGTVYMRQLYAAPHGDKSVAVVNVTMTGDKILGAKVDEFQYVETSDDWQGVPNSDNAFGENYPDGNILIGKSENNTAYSELMKEHAEATLTWQANMDAITEFVKGKTIAEVEEAAKELESMGEDATVADVVSGATFTDTKGYLTAIVDAANSGAVSVGIETSNADLKEAQILAAPHGDRSFAVATVAMDDDKLAVAMIDEFQYVDPASFGGLPNSDAAFGEGILDDQVLASKLANDDAYSALMEENGGATLHWLENVALITEFAKGKTIAELEEAVADLEAQGEDGVVADVVSGATFSDTQNYLQAIVDAAKAAQ